MNDLFNKIVRVFIFSKIDIMLGYYQVNVRKDIVKTTFNI